MTGCPMGSRTVRRLGWAAGSHAAAELFFTACTATVTVKLAMTALLSITSTLCSLLLLSTGVSEGAQDLYLRDGPVTVLSHRNFDRLVLRSKVPVVVGERSRHLGSDRGFQKTDVLLGVKMFFPAVTEECWGTKSLPDRLSDRLPACHCWAACLMAALHAAARVDLLCWRHALCCHTLF